MKKITKTQIFINFSTCKLHLPTSFKLLRRQVFVHNGKTIIPIKINRSLFGTKIGAMSLTKKLGKTIHNSERNKKRKQKKKQNK